jgi:hypothetical protein
MKNQVIGFVALKDLYASNNDFREIVEQLKNPVAWASLELEAHRLDTMSHTPNDDASLWRHEETPWRK